MAFLFWATVFDVLSVIYVLRSVIGAKFSNNVFEIMAIVVSISGSIHLAVLFYVIFRAKVSWLTFLYVRLESLFRLVLLGTVAVLWIIANKPTLTDISQDVLALMESVVLTLCSFILLFLGRMKKGRTIVAQLPFQQRILLVSVICTFVPLLIGALVFHWFEGWPFSEAWNFSNVSALTIGYGSIVPVRTVSKMFLVLFGNIMLAMVGVLIVALRIALTTRVSHTQASNWIFLVFFVIFWLFGAAIFAIIEGWSFTNSIYFVWVTLTTIGYGDFYPTTALAWEFWLLYVYVMICLLAYLLGILSDGIHALLKKGTVTAPAPAPVLPS